MYACVTNYQIDSNNETFELWTIGFPLKAPG